MTTHDKIIIGIDPGTNVMGYGILGIHGKKPELIALGVVKLNKFDSHYLRLLRINFLLTRWRLKLRFSEKMCSQC